MLLAVRIKSVCLGPFLLPLFLPHQLCFLPSPLTRNLLPHYLLLYLMRLVLPHYLLLYLMHHPIIRWWALNRLPRLTHSRHLRLLLIFPLLPSPKFDRYELEPRALNCISMRLDGSAEVAVEGGVDLLEGPLFAIKHLLDEGEGGELMLQVLNFLIHLIWLLYCINN